MPFSTHDAEAVDQLLRDVARLEIMPRFRNLAAHEVRQKSSAMDLVTDADEAAERMISRGLRRIFPQAVMIGEEATESDPSLLNRLADAELAFLIDPVDGTKNFASGLPLFGVMVAAVMRGNIVAGWIHDPVGDDTATAVRGEGAWIRRSGKRVDLRVAAPVPVRDMSGCASWNHMQEPMRSTVAANLTGFGAVASYRCAAHEYRMAAAGHYHFLVHSKLMPWDHAAGWLLHREAGGYSARFDGSPYDPTRHTGGIICAPDADSWRTIQEALFWRPVVAG
ncbi:inositol monophosphatase family protein [Microvirga mediterraneensis]|uniref:Inositol monophosphatase n=1 Tax=Microvirga mediterraneensis TaxID=2754695 RepID=A0A838BMD7_9HYPH|nr:inositol monophosphatase family protein [Microvirga mediterraneensis]MBA1155972.1 inositol monophosphatase [Microvirga mediterraneensis]